MNKKYILLFIAIILCVVSILFFIKRDRNNIDILNINNLEETVKENHYSVVYFGNQSDTIDKRLRSLTIDNNISIYYSDASLEELNELLNKYELSTKELPVYVLFTNDQANTVIDGTKNVTDIDIMIDKYFYGKIPSDEISYLVPSSATSLIKKINSKNYTVTVFGQESCTYCNLYLPVFNEVARREKLDIYYLDSESYSSEEYDKIIKLDFEIPARCTKKNKDTTLKQGFPKPMTLITKSGKFVDCIKGYVSEEELVNKLKEYKIIKE